MDLRAAAEPETRDMRKGFTLIEVLVALAIFAMSAVVLGMAYLNVIHGYAAVSRGSGQDQDVAFARQQLLTQPDLQTAENGDAFDTTDGRHIQWSATIDPTTMPNLYTVTFACQVTEPNSTTPRTITQIFTLLRPTWSQADAADQGNLLQADINRIMQIQGRSQQ
jgi:general secretion pathway protein I